MRLYENINTNKQFRNYSQTQDSCKSIEGDINSDSKKIFCKRDQCAELKFLSLAQLQTSLLPKKINNSAFLKEKFQKNLKIYSKQTMESIFDLAITI